MSIKLLAEHHLEFPSLKSGCTGSSESTLVKMPHCWKSHVTAQRYSYVTQHIDVCEKWTEEQQLTNNKQNSIDTEHADFQKAFDYVPHQRLLTMEFKENHSLG